MSGASIEGFVGKTTLGDTSPFGPAIASLHGRLYIGWKGDGNDNLNVMYSTDDGYTFGNKETSNQTSPRAPGLGTLPPSLFMTWTGSGNNQLNVARVETGLG